MSDKLKSLKAKLRLLIKALVPRLLFILHGLICVDLIVWSEEEARYWYLLSCLVLIVIEGCFNVLVRNGKEFHYFCPSAFLYIIVLIITLTALRLTQMHCLPAFADGRCKELNVSDPFKTQDLYQGDYKKRISFIEQTGMGVLIIGRWALPKGSISKEQFLQIVLIYIGTAADILELSEIYDEPIDDWERSKLEGVFYGTVGVWALSITQFVLTIALPEKELKKEEEEEEYEVDDRFRNNSFFRKKFQNNKVVPMSYMHYKSILRNQNGQHKPPVPRVQSHPEVVTFGHYDNSSPKMNPHLLKVMSQETVVMKRDSLSSTSLPIYNNGRNSMPTTYKENSRKLVRNKDSILSMDPLTVPNGTKFNNNEIPIKPNSSPSVLSTNSRGSLKEHSPSQSLSNDSRTFSRNGSADGTRNVWRRVLDQYTVSKQKNMPKKRRDSDLEDNSTGIGKKEIQSCFANNLDLIEMLQPVLMQDGPFLVLRLVLSIHFGVSTDMSYLLMGKNFLVIVVSVYRAILLSCVEPKETDEVGLDDPANRVRLAMDSNRRFSNKYALKAREEYLSRYVISTLRSTKNDGDSRTTTAV